MALTKDSVLHYWSSRYGINPRVGGRPVFTRNSAGLFTSQEGEVNTAIVNTPRFDWATLNLPSSQTERRKVLTLELARTNGWTYSDDLSNAAWTKGAATADANAATAPDGTLSASKLKEDNSAGVEHYVTRTNPALTGTTYQSTSVYLKAAERNWMWIFGSSANGSFRQWVNLATGALGSTAGGLTAYSQITAIGGGWHRVVIRWLPGGTPGTTYTYLGTTTTDGVTVFTGVTGNGIYFWRAQFEADGPFATAPIPTTTAAATRAADSCYWNFPPVPQAMMAYVRFVEQGSITVNGGRVLQIGAAGDTNARLYVVCDGTNYLTAHDTGTGVTSVLAVAPAVGDTVEILSILFSDGSVQIIQSVNGAAVSAAAQSGVKTLAGGWSDTRLWLNSVGATAIGANKFAEVKIVKYADVVGATAQTRMDELRAFELGPNSEVL